jgi:hypothetical protein
VLIYHIEDYDEDKVKLIYVEFWEVEDYLDRGAFFPEIKVIKEDKDRAVVKLTCEKDKDDDKAKGEDHT